LFGGRVVGCQTEDYGKDLIDKGKSPGISVIVFEIYVIKRACSSFSDLSNFSLDKM